MNGSSAELPPCFAEIYSRSHSLVAFPIKLDISFCSFSWYNASLGSLSTVLIRTLNPIPGLFAQYHIATRSLGMALS